MRRKFCFFDYDGTLRSRESNSIPDSALLAIDKLRAAGHFIALATGRLQSDALEVLSDVGIDTMVADGGNSITIDGKLISIEGMSLAESRAFVHRIEAESWLWAVNIENRRTCLTQSDAYGQALNTIYFKPQVVPDLNIDHIDPIYKVFVVCPRGEEKKIDFTGVTWARYSDELVYVEPTDKSRGIRKLMKHINAPLEDVIVFGDGTNDMDMFQKEWTSVAMGNAVPELKTHADLVTSDVNDDGIYNACITLGLIK